MAAKIRVDLVLLGFEIDVVLVETYNNIKPNESSHAIGPTSSFSQPTSLNVASPASTAAAHTLLLAHH